MAKAAGVPITTLRFYERRGLLVPEARSKSDYRVHDEASLDRLRFIRAAQSTGFTLDDIAALLDLRDSSGAGKCKAEVQGMIAKRLADVESRMADLKRVRGVLREAAETCGKAPGACPVMARLTIGKSAKTA